MRSLILENRLRILLEYGTYCASLMILLGLLWTDASVDFVKLGVGLFIFLPILRILMMVYFYLDEKEYLIAGVGGVVLFIIALSIMLV